MMKSLHLADVATYPVAGVSMGPLKACNFVFGPNGAGKTTLSQFLKTPDKEEFGRCSVAWEGGRVLPVVVYNREFVSQVFGETGRIRGVFTLGSEDTKLTDQIKDHRAKLKDEETKLVGRTKSLGGDDGKGGLQGDLTKAAEKLQKACLEQRKKHEDDFEPALRGVRGDSKIFMNRFLVERATNRGTLHSFDDLRERARSVFAQTLARVDTLPALNWERLKTIEEDSIFGTAIVGKTDVNIAALVTKLGNSDWVSRGVGFLEKSNPVCPFCQQAVPHALEQELSEFFDASFANNMRLLGVTVESYASAVAGIKQVLDVVAGAPVEFHEPVELAGLITVFEARLSTTQEQMARKVAAPSSKVAIDGVSSALAAIHDFVVAVNARIVEHNRLVANADAEQRKLSSDFWRFLIDVELERAAADYDDVQSTKGRAVQAISAQIVACEFETKRLKNEIESLEQKVTSTQPTVDKINRTLQSFNFTNFHLAPADEPHTYQLIRQNGKAAHHTLSEGEKTFVTFLYFYHRAQAGETAVGIDDDRVVVLDDPVSSLDSDILFIVSSLVREMARNVRDKKGPIKQLIVTTHNVYFHKEVTFSNGKTVGDTAHWTVRKRGGLSEFHSHGNRNPIKSSYELLWHDVRKPEGRGDTLPNTLRRILESYFQLLGGIDNEDIVLKFGGDDLIACRAMLSWVNDGSHGVQDDIHMAPADLSVDVYLDVFERIFTEMGQSGHYRMMMGDAAEAPKEAEAA
jgi:wobble nucleotide-excising tRNase